MNDDDKVLVFGEYGNFSLSGFEMVLTRYVSTYIITYYLPSGKSISEVGVSPDIEIAEETDDFRIKTKNLLYSFQLDTLCKIN